MVRLTHLHISCYREEPVLAALPSLPALKELTVERSCAQKLVICGAAKLTKLTVSGVWVSTIFLIKFEGVNISCLLP